MNNAHHFGITNATFNSYTTNVNLDAQVETVARGILNEARALEATHTSKTASYAPKYKPGTREKVIADIVSWVEGQDRDILDGAVPTSVLWFCGPAGGGKTCIMREVVDRCQHGCLLASYFFSTRVMGLDNEHPFVATIAHQLITMNPNLKTSILKAIHHCPTIFDESLDFQMEKLIAEPLESDAFREDACEMPVPKVVVAVDGFDECREAPERQHLLHVLRSLIQRLPVGNVLVIIAGRPELDLRTSFEHRKLQPITRVIRLQDYDGTEDIYAFICDEFQRIRETHPMKESIPEGWPVEKIVNTLTDKSSGNFIYPAVLMKHVDNPRRNPVTQLEEIMATPQASSSPLNPVNPLADLDALYTHILHPPESDMDLIRRLLHTILGMTATTSVMGLRSSSFIDEFLFLADGTTKVALCDLHSIVSIPSSDAADQSISFHHKSLEDYLVSPSRSKDVFQSPYKTHLNLALLCVSHLQNWEANPLDCDTASTLHAAMHWDDHVQLLCKHKPPSTTVPNTILDFDPRIIWRYIFVRNQAYFTLNLARREIHSSLCSYGLCIHLCRLLGHMEQQYSAAKVFHSTFRTEDHKERIDGLALFDQESGLFEPLSDVLEGEQDSHVASMLWTEYSASSVPSRDENHAQAVHTPEEPQPDDVPIIPIIPQTIDEDTKLVRHYLAYTPGINPLVPHNLSSHSLHVREQYPTVALIEPATQPPVRSFRIICPGYLPWAISVQAETNPNYVTVGAVLTAIHQQLRLPVTQQEYTQLGSERHKHAVDAAYFSRLELIVDPIARDREASKGVKRIDFLRGRNRFKGLSALSESGTWELNVD